MSRKGEELRRGFLLGVSMILLIAGLILWAGWR